MQQYPILYISQTGQKIKQLMKMHNYSVQDIQKFLGFSTPQSIYHWFSGHNSCHRLLLYYEKLS